MEHNTAIIKIALADDHILLRKSLANLIDTFKNCSVIFQADDGTQVVKAIKAGFIPDFLILDQNMPEMDGMETAQWLFTHHPEVNILMLSMFDSDLNLIRLLRYGVKGFLKKDVEPAELEFALQSVIKSGFYYSSHASNKLVKLLRSNLEDELELQNVILSDKEITFLKLCATELPYRDIAQRMGLNPRTIEKLRGEIFEKLEVQTRIGLVMVAVRHGIINL